MPLWLSVCREDFKQVYRSILDFLFGRDAAGDTVVHINAMPGHQVDATSSPAGPQRARRLPLA